MGKLSVQFRRAEVVFPANDANANPRCHPSRVARDTYTAAVAAAAICVEKNYLMLRCVDPLQRCYHSAISTSTKCVLCRKYQKGRCSWHQNCNSM